MFDSPRIFPPRLEWPSSVNDLSEVPQSATRIRLTTKTVGYEKLREFQCLSALWCFGVNQQKLNHISQCVSLRDLYLDYNLRITELSPLKKLPCLDVLRLDSCSTIDSLKELGALSQLTGLAIENFKSVHDLRPLAVLTNLRELAIEGSLWTRMKIESLAPISGLSRIEYLSLTNLKVADESLEPLTHLTNLKELQIANFYPFAEFARLSAKLPNCECQWFAPYIVTNLKCKKCETENRVMLTGKGKGVLCPKCDAARLARHVKEFERLKQPN